MKLRMLVIKRAMHVDLLLIVGVIVVFMLNKQQTTSTRFGMVEKLTCT